MVKTKVAPLSLMANSLQALLDSNLGPTSGNALAAASGVGQSTISRILNGEGGTNAATLARLAAVYGQRIDFFFSEDPVGDLRRPIVRAGSATPIKLARNVPVVGTTEGGPPDLDLSQLGHPVGHGDQYLEVASADPNAYGLRVVGDSMSPRIMDGEWIVVEPNTEIHPGDEVVIKTTAGEVMVKTLAARNGDTVILSSVNEAFKRITKEVSEIALIHYVGPRLPARAVRRRIDVPSYQGPDRRVLQRAVSVDRRKPSG
jgi:SOS-response transcriptional repressor LexA